MAGMAIAEEEALAQGEADPLLERLEDDSAEVRVAAFEALTRLPLHDVDWIRVGRFAHEVLASEQRPEFPAVLEAAPWIPLGSVRAAVRQIALGDSAEHREPAARAMQEVDEAEPIDVGAIGTPLRPAWADGAPPGFRIISPAEREAAVADLSRRDLWASVSEVDWWGFERGERIPDGLDLPGGLASAAVTLLFQQARDPELAGDTPQWWKGNGIVGWVHAMQGRFEPDLDGLFGVYAGQARDLFAGYRGWSEGAAPGRTFSFVRIDDSGGPRSFCYQIGWTVSRGGLRDLVPGLTDHLAHGDPEERMAAAYLVADAADYVLQANPALFGGGFAPERRLVRSMLVPEAGPPEMEATIAATAEPPMGEPEGWTHAKPPEHPPPMAEPPEPTMAEEAAPDEADMDMSFDTGAFNVGALEAALEPPAERVVNTGFADKKDARQTVGERITLASDTDYLFWVEIGEPLPDSIEVTPIPVDAAVPEGADLVVALFGFPGELELKSRADVGELRLADGRAVVTRQPGERKADPSATETRMRFPVRTPKDEGSFKLRCHLYYQQVLIQSRVVTAQVTRESQEVRGLKPALASEVDFTLAPSLYPSHLQGLSPHRVSIMLNQSGDGTHEFRILGADGKEKLKSQASFEANELQGGIDDIRGALRLAAWGTEQEWKGQGFRYDQGRSSADLLEDLIHLARRGYRFYDQIAGRLAGRGSQKALRALMLESGYVQVAIKTFTSYVVPAAAIYDSLLQTKVRSDREYSLCDEFEAALGRPEPLEQTRCFKGDCPHRDEKLVICPSGFWGYRHALGLPVSVGSAPDSPTLIEYDTDPAFAVGISTDPDLHGWADHEKGLRALLPGLGWDERLDRQTTLDLMKQTRAPLVYFYCHGGVDGRVPFIQVGPKDELPISREDLRTEEIEWDKPRPLVFINGCHTTALSPETAIDLVSGFVETSHAAGVIGTEITIFESLAGGFGLEFFRRFLAGIPVGEAVRQARLALLKQRNPMGLVYIPFVTASLKLTKAGA
jgi:hypothetical protein